MVREEFWQLIEVLDGSSDPGAVEALTQRLVDLGAAVCVEFADELAAALHALDGPDWFGRDVRDVAEPDGSAVVPMSADVFLYARAAVVAAGREVYERVLADPAAMSGRWQVADGEFLLSAAADAYERVTGLHWDHDTPLSQETGANTAWWFGGTTEPDLPVPRPWFTLSGGSTVGLRESPVYVEAQLKLVQALTTDPEWVAWWRSTGIPQLWVSVQLIDGPAGPWELSSGAASVHLTVSTDGRTALEGSWDEKHARAAADLDEWFAYVEDHLQLPPRPSLPPLLGPYSY